jgi:hypothetical protein
MAGAIILIWNQNNQIDKIELERNLQIERLNNIIQDKEDSINIISAEREVFLSQREELQDLADSLELSLKKKQSRVKTTVAKLPDDEIIHLANKAYGGDTTGTSLVIPKNTVVYLVDLSEEHRQVLQEFDILMKIKNNYYEQLQIDTAIFDKYESEIRFKDQIIEASKQQTVISQEAYFKLRKAQRRKNTVKDIIIIGLGGLVTWQVLTK